MYAHNKLLEYPSSGTLTKRYWNILHQVRSQHVRVVSVPDEGYYSNLL
jgi:hypothetical protein